MALEVKPTEPVVWEIEVAMLTLDSWVPTDANPVGAVGLVWVIETAPEYRVGPGTIYVERDW